MFDREDVVWTRHRRQVAKERVVWFMKMWESLLVKWNDCGGGEIGVPVDVVGWQAGFRVGAKISVRSHHSHRARRGRGLSGNLITCLVQTRPLDP